MRELKDDLILGSSILRRARIPLRELKEVESVIVAYNIIHRIPLRELKGSRPMTFCPRPTAESH